jgi:hypothetical protein
MTIEEIQQLSSMRKTKDGENIDVNRSPRNEEESPTSNAADRMFTDHDV